LGINDSHFTIGRTKEKKPFLDFEPSSSSSGNVAAASALAGEGGVEDSAAAAGREGSNSAREACAQRRFSNFNFNATHHGRVVALACEPTLVVGVDVMNEVSLEKGNSDSHCSGKRGAGGCSEKHEKRQRHSFTDCSPGVFRF
jgi:hypothetical protein